MLAIASNINGRGYRFYLSLSLSLSFSFCDTACFERRNIDVSVEISFGSTKILEFLVRVIRRGRRGEEMERANRVFRWHLVGSLHSLVTWPLDGFGAGMRAISRLIFGSSRGSVPKNGAVGRGV